MNSRRPWAIIGNPENRRILLFQEALASLGTPLATVLGYQDLLTGRDALERIPPRAIVRIDSPGEDFAVEKLLLAAGERAAAAEGGPFITARQLADLPEDRGRILFPRQWYLGFVGGCTVWGDFFSARHDVLVTSGVDDLRIMFDKSLCHRTCLEAGISVPIALGAVTSFDELVSRMEAAALQRVFVKLANSSSASGVVAVHRRADRIEATTSAELVRIEGETRLYNSLWIRRYTKLEDVRDLINALALHRVHVEEWLPKAAVGGRVCDLRALIVAGRLRHMVVRTSRSPITNLHLGNRRGSLSEFLGKLFNPQMDALRSTCRNVAELFPRSLRMGVDVLFSPNFQQHYVLEVNAFGDLLPGAVDEGQDPYQAQIAAVQ